MTDDITLLRRYASQRSEPAFTELVRRRLGLVYAVALPQVGGDTHLAQDVAQKVFIELARNATTLLDRPTLGGWLYRVTHHVAVDLVRAERRRRARELRSEFMPDDADISAATPWDKLWPLIDEALRALRDRDRDAIALRFFEQRAFADIGRLLQLSEEAARKRVERALDQMAGALERRGITSTSGAVAVALAERAAGAAPAGLAPAIAGTALASVTAVSGGGVFTAFASLKLAAFFGAGALGVGVIGFQQLSRAGQEAAPATPSRAAEFQARLLRAEQEVLARPGGTTTARKAAPAGRSSPPATVASNTGILVVDLPYLYDNSRRTQAFNATIKAKDEVAQKEVHRMNAQGNALVEEYRKLPPESEPAKRLLVQIHALKSLIQTFIGATRDSLQDELVAHRRTEVARIVAIVEAYRAEGGFTAAYDSCSQANVGMEPLPAGLQGIDRTDAVFARIDR